MRGTALRFISLLALALATLRAQPICFAESLETVTDGTGLVRASVYRCPPTLGIGVTQRSFFLVVQHFTLDNAVIQFSRRLPIVKDTGGASLDRVKSMELRPGFYYLVVWRGEDHQIMPTFWNTPVVTTFQRIQSVGFPLVAETPQ